MERVSVEIKNDKIIVVGMVDGIQHDLRCDTLRTPVFETRLPCSCGAETRHNQEHRAVVIAFSIRQAKKRQLPSGLENCDICFGDGYVVTMTGPLICPCIQYQQQSITKET